MESGYKQTELGIIPKDWDIVKVDNLVSITTGSKNTQDKIDDGKFPFFVRSQDIERINTYSFDKEAILTAGDGVGTGKIFHYINCKFDVHQRVYVMADFVDKLNGKYFYWQFKSKFYDHVMSMTAKSSVDSIRREMIADMPILMPRLLKEQQEIAKALGDADALIEGLEKLIVKKRLIKQGTMQELLIGKRRLPGFSGEWVIKKLGDLGNCLRGVTYNGDYDLSAHDTSKTTRLLRANNVQSETINFDNLQFVNSERVSEAQILRQGDVLICMANGSRNLVGKAGAFNATHQQPYTFGAFMGCYRLVAGLSDFSFIFYLFGSQRYNEYLNIVLAGSTINNLNPSAIEDMSFLIPSKEEQTAIADIISDMVSEIATLKAKLVKARQIKQGMMQELLTGRIRLV